LICATLVSVTIAVGAEPVITYSKYFKGSKPETVLIVVPKAGECTYKEGADDDQPLKFQMAEAEAAQIFELAEKLGHFSRPLESGLKVANMGTKTFRYEDGSVHNEVKFNYAADADAQALLNWFERITETEQHYIDLDRSVHFDKLGVNDALLQLQITYEKKRLIAPQQFLPLLDRVAKNESFLHMARERAAMLAEIFRNQQTAAAQPQSSKAVQP
jgi:hypothetical protein